MLLTLSPNLTRTAYIHMLLHTLDSQLSILHTKQSHARSLVCSHLLYSQVTAYQHLRRISSSTS